MRSLLKAIVVLLLLATVARAEVYRCRDAAGRLFFTDDPTHFPPGCREEGGPPGGALNVVPMPAPAGARQETETFLRERQEKRQAARQQQADWLEKARDIAERYRQAQRERHYPRLHTQARIKAALAGMAQAAKDKAALLQSMAAAGATGDQVEEVSRLLEGVEAP